MTPEAKKDVMLYTADYLVKILAWARKALYHPEVVEMALQYCVVRVSRSDQVSSYPCWISLHVVRHYVVLTALTKQPRLHLPPE